MRKRERRKLQAPMEQRIQALVQEPWRDTCRRNRLCFRCRSSFCDHCCQEHWHRHHPAEAVRDRVATRRKPSCARQAPRRQWVRLETYTESGCQEKKLDPVEPQGATITRALVWSNLRKLQSKNHEHNQVHVGKGRGMVQALAAGDYNQALRPDRFCTICMSSFSSACCALHIERHHPDADALGVWIIEVVHVDGWAAVAPSALLPDDVLHDVQVLHADGAVLYPLRRLEFAAAVHHLSDVPGQHNCDAPGCHEMIPEQPRFCSLRCKAAVVWAA